MCLLCVRSSSAHYVCSLPLKLTVTPFHRGRNPGLPKAAQEGDGRSGIRICAGWQSQPEYHTQFGLLFATEGPGTADLCRILLASSWVLSLSGWSPPA